MVSSAPRSRHARVASALAGLVMLVGLLPAGVAAAPPSGSPTLLSPTEGQTVSSNPTFSWTAVGGAVKYRVQVSTSPSFSPLAYNVDTVNRKATPPADLPLGFLYWRVAATDGAAGVGSFTNGTFTKQWGAAPTITSPDDHDTFDFPTAASPVPVAAARRCQVVHARDRHRPWLRRSDSRSRRTTRTSRWPSRRRSARSRTGGSEPRHRRQASSRIGAQTRQYTYTWPTGPDAPDARQQRRHRGSGHRLQLEPRRRREDLRASGEPERRLGEQPCPRRDGQEHEVLAADDAQ